MSLAPASITRLTVPALRACKGQAPLVVLTAYTAPVARLLDPHVDILLVGDSLGMAVYGQADTLNVPLEWMIAHARAVVGASQQALVVVDIPFGRAQASPTAAYEVAARLMAESGAQAVKLEGGAVMAETVRFLSERGIPVMGHVGLLPQHYHALGGFKSQGKTEEARARILADAQAIAEAGAFSIVAEAIQGELARELTERVPVPIIGIGAHYPCDGQVLVVDDLIGLTEKAPSFAPAYAQVGQAITQAVTRYAAEIRAGEFPKK